MAGFKARKRDKLAKIPPWHAPMEVPTVYTTTELTDITGCTHVEPVSAKELAVRLIERGCSLAYLKANR